MQRQVLYILSVLLLGAVAFVAPRADAAQPPPPSSIAAVGDSITQAYDACCWYGNHPTHSWTTGGSGWDGVRSHYERLLVLNPDIAGKNFNDAASGARMAAGPAQAARAVDQRAGYVTILLGANDVCTSSPSTMTSVGDFRTQYQATLSTLMSGLPRRAHVFVSSIPDVYQLWDLYHSNATAQWVWDTANICQSMLSPARTEADRQAVRERIIAFNAVLAQGCNTYSRCRYDSDATFNYAFTRDDVSTLDYFHPSLTGQAHLATVTWNHSWWN